MMTAVQILTDSTTPQYQFPDTDGDGVDDRWDQCLNEPENYNDYLDKDGCPDILGAFSDGLIDSDYDSIPDSVDACPLDRENFNKFQDSDGCPDEVEYIISGDTDGDGILNQFDICPYNKETYNKFQDDDGCPDSIVNNKLAFDY